jgi:hypothetical protein
MCDLTPRNVVSRGVPTARNSGMFASVPRMHIGLATRSVYMLSVGGNWDQSHRGYSRLTIRPGLARTVLVFSAVRGCKNVRGLRIL